MQIAFSERAPGRRRHGPPHEADRRAFIYGVAMLVATAASGARLPVVRASAIRWSGAHGRTLHGYMAIPAKAHGRQPAVLVIGEASALPPLPDPAARGLVEQVAAAGLLACTADNVTELADLRASLAWLRFNRYATGKVALIALGKGAESAIRLATAERSAIGALLVLGGTAGATSLVPSLALGWHPSDPALPAGAVTFLKEHLV